jgi:hypothetical protein
MKPTLISVIADILAGLGIAAEVAEPILAALPAALAVDKLAEALIAIAQKAIAAHEAVTGQPIDLALLKSIDPLL